MRRTWRRTLLRLGAVAMALTAGAVGCSGAPAPEQPPATAPAASGAPPPTAGSTSLAPAPEQPSGQTFFVPATPAGAQLAELRAKGRTAEADTLARIAGQPAARWLGEQDTGGTAEELSRQAAAVGRTAVLVAYAIPHRDCGQFSAGGVADAAAYRAWITAIGAGLADRGAWVVLEPDAVAHSLEGCGLGAADVAERYALLAFAVKELKKHQRVRVYLDAGNAGWVQDRQALVGALRSSGIGEADGFAVNVANFYTTDRSAAYGSELSAALGGKHFVIDTSRNGNGPLGGEAWCNPPGRRLGERPTQETGRPWVDAYLWVKNPGESDGDCGRGEPRPGEFWLPYALGLASDG
ncbi:glycoside hydrolase family 6 protein [Kitasatospora sp. NPDC050543]|uniref:glycoside hydrolase family 6 protein n=1 Tax=Kitasatospora sp. NPDC050543 TaxID=3364054 RepID=UPI0037A52A02